MDNTMHQKSEFPTVYVTEKPSTGRVVGLRRYWSIIAKLLFSSLLLGICLALVYEMIAEKHNYDDLLEKYNDLIREKNSISATPAATLRRRVDESVSFAYTTVTMTQQGIITVTDKVPASPTTSTSSAMTTGVNSTLSVCGPVFSTVTITVTEPKSTSTHSSRITTTTIIVTATSSSATDTSTGTGTGSTTAEVTSATDALFTTTTSGYGPYFNTSSPTLSGTGYSGSMFTTASFTLVLPTGSAGTDAGAATSSDKQSTTHTTSTGENGPTTTPVTGAGSRLTGHGSIVVLVVATVVAMFLI